jgi:hypothetical protein
MNREKNMNPKILWPSLILALLSIDGQSVFAKSKYDQTIENLCGLNQKSRTLCSESPSASPTATPIQNSLFSDPYFKRIVKDGVSAEIDWKWINAFAQLDPWKASIDQMKTSKTRKQKLETRFGKCWIKMNGTYGLNESQDKIILTESNDYELYYREYCKKDPKSCPEGFILRVIAKNKADPPMTKETMNTDYLKPIRDAEQLIEEKCR